MSKIPLQGPTLGSWVFVMSEVVAIVLSRGVPRSYGPPLDPRHILTVGS